MQKLNKEQEAEVSKSKLSGAEKERQTIAMQVKNSFTFNELCALVAKMIWNDKKIEDIVETQYQKQEAEWREAQKSEKAKESKGKK